MTDALDRLVSVYRGWQELEERLNSGTLIVDFDLAPVVFKPQQFSSRFEVFDALARLQGDIPAGHPFLRSRVSASIALIRVLLGERMPFADYIQQTLDLPAEPLPEGVVRNQRDTVCLLLESEGLHFDKNARMAVARRFHFEEDHIAQWVSKAVAQAAQQVSAFLSMNPEPGVDIQFVQAQVYWKSWTEGRTGKNATVRFNTTPRRPYLKGENVLLAFHEAGGHVLQMESWRRRIASGELHPAYGVTIVHGPEQFLSEGIAQVLTDTFFDNDQLSAAVRWARAYERYLLYIYQRAHVDVNRNESLSKSVEYVKERAPFEGDSAIEAELRGRREDPVLRTYQFVYAASASYFLTVLSHLGRERFQELLRRLYTEPLSTSAVKQAVKAYGTPETLDTCSPPLT